MAVINSIADREQDMKAWRHLLHQHPETSYEEVWTSDFIAAKLQSFGIETHRGMGKTGVVGVLRGTGNGTSAIGLRADMDALPMQEMNEFAHVSKTPGRMHACGHDGHTVMLLGAARYLAETRNFKGRVALIFQPAEENGGGAEVMVQEGIMDTFDIGTVYGIHNAPGFVAGGFYTTPDAIMAAVDTFHIDIKGVGGHGAMPHETCDPVIAACGIAQAIQTIVSRNHYALDDLVVSVTQIHTGTVDNVIPDTAYMNGTVRTFDPKVQDMVERRLNDIVAGQAASYGVTAELRFERGYPATINHATEAAHAAEVAREVAGENNVIADAGREMGAEDFAYMLQERPGAYLFLGQGESAGLHHPEYNFNDEIAPVGASFFARLVERSQPLSEV